MKIVMEKNRTSWEIREALREVYEQVAEASADALMFDFEAENLEVEDYLAFDRDGVWGLDWSLFDEDDFKRWEKELQKTLIKSDWRDEDIEEVVKLLLPGDFVETAHLQGLLFRHGKAKKVAGLHPEPGVQALRVQNDPVHIEQHAPNGGFFMI